MAMQRLELTDPIFCLRSFKVLSGCYNGGDSSSHVDFGIKDLEAYITPYSITGTLSFITTLCVICN